MSRIRALLAVVTAGALAQLTNVACGPACLDDRCSLRPGAPQVTKVDYTAKKPASSSSVTPVATSGSAAPVVAAGSGSAAPVAAGAGSALPATGSATPVAAGSGSAAGSAARPAPATPLATGLWQLWDGDQFKMHVISKGTFPANTTLRFEIVKTPAKTPFIITLLVRGGGANASEGVWNDCPEGKVKCDGGGTKTHVTKKPGQILLQGGINWTVTGVADEGKGTLVTWTNNLSREVLTLRLLK